MKKAQVLSALALAFALGVVAPVASTYATVNYPQGTTQAQKDALMDEASAASKAFSDLDHASDYIALYDKVETKDSGLRDQVKATVKSLVNFYNNNATYDKESVNNHIQVLVNAAVFTTGGLYEKNGNNYINLDADKVEVTTTQAPLYNLKKLSNVTTLKEAYDAIDSLKYNAKQNQDIIQANYDTSKPIVISVNNAMTEIINACDAFLAEIRTEFGTLSTNLGEPLAWATNYLKPVSDSAYDALVDSQAWVDATDANTGTATRYGLFLNAVSKLPKYAYVKDLKDAKVEFDKITNSQSISYSNAQKAIAAFNAAIKNFRDGKTDNSGTGDGENKPGDDNKDPNAPDTGILADGEANASTTVAMVAGIATALTAAGAGVVAYRNARRSTRK